MVWLTILTINGGEPVSPDASLRVSTGINIRGYLLSSRVIWGGFRPVTEEYRLPRKMQGDGQVLSCPRCMGMLCIKGDNPTKKAETDKVIAAREEARKRILEQAKNDGEVHEHLPSHGVDADMAPIILGKTRISAR